MKKNSLVVFKSDSGIGFFPTKHWESVLAQYDIIPILYSVLIDNGDDIRSKLQSALEEDDSRIFYDIINEQLLNAISQN